MNLLHSTWPLRLAFFIVSFSILSPTSQAEPWMSNRFAQNCAACHAPGRFNLPPRDRRCTLTCQGCHVNPNGGGIRNEYGIWVQKRWLRSFRSQSLLGSKKRPAPHFAQAYVTGKSKGKKSKQKKNTKNPHWVRPKKGELPQMVVDGSSTYREKDYDKHSYTDWKVDATSMEQFLSRVPEDDPWRLEREKMVTAGGDFRYFFGQLAGERNSVEIPKDKQKIQALMGADIGVRVRPVRKHLQLVVESRFVNGYEDHRLEQGFTKKNLSGVRSAYALVDQLPFNSWLMGGIYRPHFGHYNPDHNTIANEISGFRYNSSVKAFGLGTAPNVPFLNFHLIRANKDRDTLNAFDYHNGYNVNLGGRFVTGSLSGKISYWNTQHEVKKDKQEMTSVSLGGMWKRFILNLESLRVTKTISGRTDSGNINSSELKFRFWRENYLVANFNFSNVALNMESGSASEMMGGFKSFLIPNLELETLYVQRQQKKSESDTKDNVNIVQVQAHYFF